MKSAKHFMLLLWKNWLLQKRKVVLTIVEIGLPICVALIMLIVRQLVSSTSYDDITTWPSFQVESLPRFLLPPGEENPSNGQWELAYAPDLPVVQRVMDTVALNLGVNVTGLGFSTEDYLLEFVSKQDGETTNVWGAIVFMTDNFPDDNTLPRHTRYKVRPWPEQRNTLDDGMGWRVDQMFLAGSIETGPRHPEDATGGSPGYEGEGFLAVQNMLDRAIILEHNSSARVEDVSVLLQRFPFPPYLDDSLVYVVYYQLSFMLLLSMLVVVPNMAKEVVLEKERTLKELMKMMGLRSWLQWAAWYTKYALFLLISTVVSAIFFTVNTSNGAVINASDGFLIFLFFYMYALSSICFCFMCCAFFKKANSAAAASVILLFLSYIPYVLMLNDINDIGITARMFASIFHTTAMSLGCMEIGKYEATGAGLQWSNMFKPINVDDDYTMAHAFLMLILDSFLYIIILWYADNVFPGEYGVPRKLYFPFTRDYWCGSDSRVMNEDIEERSETQDPDKFEPAPPSVKAGIKIRNLRKEFGEKVAVAGTNLDMYENQITALLGHNGAGKTTTMSMLTGFLPPTSGTAYLTGYDIRKDIDNARENLGLCPQHNVLFDTLTVREHLKFFALLKGVPREQVDNEVQEMISVLHLEDKTEVPSKALSGGMKRKLSVGIALIGGTKIVILDEPTSGMDPEARRQMWDILQQQREGRTMVLSTHFMDEADLLGDRIAIMAEGVVQCSGSSLFLKNKYGVGYHMIMVKDKTCNVSDVTEIIKRFVPEANLESNISAELSYNLPQESVPQFESLFSYLEQHSDDLGISSFGASVTTMEEVFIKVGESLDETLKEKLHQTDYHQGHDNKAYNGEVPLTSIKNNDFTEIEIDSDERGVSTVPTAPVPSKQHSRLTRTLSMEDKYGLQPVMGVTFGKNSGSALIKQQFMGMVMKRIIHTMRNKLVTATQLIMPLVFTIFAGILLKTIPAFSGDSGSPPQLTLSMDYFESSFISTPYVSNVSIPSGAAVIDSLVNNYQSSINVDQFELIEDMTIVEFLADKGVNDMDAYNREYMTAALFSAPSVAENSSAPASITGLFNNRAFHTVAITLNALSNTILKHFIGSEYSVEAINHPLPKTEVGQVEDSFNTASLVSFIVSMEIQFGMAFLTASFVVFIIKEKASKSKHIQFVSGVHVANYWFSTFLWDFINFMVPATLQLIVFAAFDFEPYMAGSNLGIVYLMYILFGIAVLPYTYLLCYLFNVPASGYVWTIVINFLTGITAVQVIYMLRIPGLGTESIANGLEWAFYIFLPNFGFGNSLSGVWNNYEYKKLCEVFTPALCLASNISNPCCPNTCEASGICVTYQDNYFAWESPGIGRPVFFMIVQSVVFFMVIFAVESGTIASWMQRLLESSVSEADEESMMMSRRNSQIEDNDVMAERLRVTTTPLEQLQQTDSLILMELRKFYGHFLAVDHLSVGIPQGECFGLLGVNGAGKTTTFKMMTGDVPISSGEAFLDSFSVKRNIKEVQTRLGYCPQFDALIEQMTVTETLVMYARLRGVVEQNIPEVISKLMKSLLLSDHKETLAGNLSGGNKRKLSTAIALIGDPPVIFLDEPTTGMDPVARRLLWDTLTKVRESGRTLVLTSHSMEECEALCTRIAIMVNGQFKCLGSTQHLKNKFGEGYTLLVKLGGVSDEEIDARTEALMSFINETFPGSVLKDTHQGYLHYQIKTLDIGWAQIFGTMERAKERFFIEDYSVSQTTLEQVFINFARAQRQPRDSAPGLGKKCGNLCKYLCCCLCFCDCLRGHKHSSENTATETTLF